MCPISALFSPLSLSTCIGPIDPDAASQKKKKESVLAAEEKEETATAANNNSLRRRVSFAQDDATNHRKEASMMLMLMRRLKLWRFKRGSEVRSSRRFNKVNTASNGHIAARQEDGEMVPMVAARANGSCCNENSHVHANGIATAVSDDTFDLYSRLYIIRKHVQ